MLRFTRKIQKEHLILAIVLLITLILVSPKVMPTYLEINAFDEAKYIESGRLLLRGEIRNLSWGPIVALLYAPLHLIFSNSPDWFVLEARSGRLILFALLWLSTYQLGRQLRSWINPFVLMGSLFVSTSLIGVLSNQSDAIFTAFSALSLSQILAFRHNLNLKHVWLGSLFLSLAILARFEGILLLPIYLGLCLWLGRRERDPWTIAIRFFLPAIVVGSIYLVSFWSSTGSIDLGVQGKSWDSFEVNQPLPDGSNENQAQRELTWELFGTAAENQYSVFKAFQRNPGAFLQRILTNVLRTPNRYLDLYGNRLGPAYLIFSLFGLALMFLKKEWEIPIIFLLWSLQSAVSLIFLPLHFLKQIVYIPILFTAAALSEQGLLSRDSQRHILASIILFALLIIYAAIDGKPAFLVSGIIMFVALLLASLVQGWQTTRQPSGLFALIFLSAGLLLRPPFEFPNYPPIGQSAHEQVVHYLNQELDEGQRILSNLPLPAVAAGLQEVDPGQLPPDLSTAGELYQWMIDAEISAIYNPRHLKTDQNIRQLLIQGEGQYFHDGYSAEDGNFEVWVIQTN